MCNLCLAGNPLSQSGCASLQDGLYLVRWGRSFLLRSFSNVWNIPRKIAAQTR